jgi:hypothetical protein
MLFDKIQMIGQQQPPNRIGQQLFTRYVATFSKSQLGFGL